MAEEEETEVLDSMEKMLNLILDGKGPKGPEKKKAEERRQPITWEASLVEELRNMDLEKAEEAHDRMYEEILTMRKQVEEAEALLELQWKRAGEEHIHAKIATIAKTFGQLIDTRYTKYQYKDEATGVVLYYDQYCNTISAWKFIEEKMERVPLYDLNDHVYKEAELAPVLRLYKSAQLLSLVKEHNQLQTKLDGLKRKL